MSDSPAAPPPPPAPRIGERPRQIAHALRTPLGLIMSALQDLETSTENPLLTLGNRGVQQIRRIADRLSLLGRLEQGEAQCSDPVDLSALVEQAIAEIATTRPRRRITVRLGATPPRAPVLGSAEHLTAAIAELVDNAVRSAKTSVEVSIREDERDVHVEVRDDGRGLPSATTSSTGLGHGGLGIGLQLVRMITTGHGGRFTLQDDDEGGALARLSLRRAAD